MPSPEELRSLLEIPSESLSVEYKSWLDLTQNIGKATLAKAAIALANEGGGIIVLGMREDTGDGGALRSQLRPSAIARYSQDDINAAIERYSDPAFHCGLMFAPHPLTAHEHAFVVVPGGITVPVMCRRTCEGVISQHRCYIRKPGPRSEEPFTAEEWRGLLERCVQARRENMLDAIRLIVHGHGTPAQGEAVLHNALATFGDTARARWRQLVTDLPPDDDARMPNGRYEIEVEFIGTKNAGNATEMLRRMTEASRINHTGWGPFVLLTREPFEPRPIEGNVEAWIGYPVKDRARRDPAHCDFWRAHPSGSLFLLRGYVEDSSDRVEPATIFDVTMPIWMVGEAMLYASRLARLFDSGDPDIAIRCHYYGLRGRRLDCLTPGRHFSFARISTDDTADLRTQATMSQMEDNLVEVLHPLLVPLYERFAFFELTRELVRVEIERMRKNRF
jgi:Putative DNA-binding domain